MTEYSLFYKSCDLFDKASDLFNKGKYEEAINFFEKSKNLGNFKAAITLVRIYFCEIGVKRNDKLANHYLEEAELLASNFVGFFMIGMIWMHYEYNIVRAIDNFENALLCGQLPVGAAIKLANYLTKIYCSGNGVKRDLRKTLYYAKLTKKLGDNSNDDYIKVLEKQIRKEEVNRKQKTEEQRTKEEVNRKRKQPYKNQYFNFEEAKKKSEEQRRNRERVERLKKQKKDEEEKRLEEEMKKRKEKAEQKLFEDNQKQQKKKQEKEDKQEKRKADKMVNDILKNFKKYSEQKNKEQETKDKEELEKCKKQEEERREQAKAKVEKLKKQQEQMKSKFRTQKQVKRMKILKETEEIAKRLNRVNKSKRFNYTGYNYTYK